MINPEPVSQWCFTEKDLLYNNELLFILLSVSILHYYSFGNSAGYSEVQLANFFSTNILDLTS